MTSDPATVFVWTWLPGASDPVVAGRLDAVGSVLEFTYEDVMGREAYVLNTLKLSGVTRK